MSLICFCGNNLFSDGYIWSCPIKGNVTAFDKDKEVHKGVVIVDKRLTAREGKPQHGKSQ